MKAFPRLFEARERPAADKVEANEEDVEDINRDDGPLIVQKKKFDIIC